MSLVADNPDFDNGPALSDELRNSSVMNLPVGEYHFHTAPNVDLDAWHIRGAAPFHIGYGHANALRAPTSFIFHGDGTFLDVPFRLPSGFHRFRGPYSIRDLFMRSDSPDSSILSIGNESDDETPFSHVMGLNISGCTFWLQNQRWHSAWPDSHLSFVQEDGTINRDSPRGFCVRVTKAYRSVLQDVDAVGGFWCLKFNHCDHLELRNVRANKGVFGIKHQRGQGGRASHSVPGSWDIYAEGNEGIGIWSDSGMIDMRAETGYGRRIGEFDTPINEWTIRRRSEWLDIDSSADMRSYIEPGFPIKIETDDDEFYLLTEEVEDNRVRFAHADHQCRFDSLTTGKTLKRYFGSLFVIDTHRATLTSKQSWGCNNRVPNLPYGFIAVAIGPSIVHGATVGWGNFDDSNRVAVIGHNEAHVRHQPEVQWIGGADIISPIHPFVRRIP